jgi:DNA-binding ferritin-like protein
MDKLAVLLKCENLVAHNFHNLAQGMAFFADHKAFEKIYEELEEDYDAVIERDIGLGEEGFDITKITREAGEKAASYDPADMRNDEMCAVLLGMERQIQAECERLNPDATLGTQNLLQGIADRSEMRVYKLRQRIK